MPGTRASAWATPIPIAIGSVTSLTPLSRAPQPIGEPQDRRHRRRASTRDEADLAEAGLDQVVEQQPSDRRRDRGGHQQPRQASVGVAGERAIAHGRQTRPGRGASQSARK